MSLSEKDRALKDLRDRLQAFVGAVAEITDCSDDVDAINRADALLQAAREEAYKEGWNDREDDLISGVNRIAPEQPPQEGAGEPVAWRVKDFADGWFFYGKERGAEAMRAQVDGFLVQPLFTSPPTDPRIKALEEALRPFASLDVPAKPQGNAGAYSIRHADILRARAALTPSDQAVKGDEHG